jgi:hypothetical protein
MNSVGAGLGFDAGSSLAPLAHCRPTASFESVEADEEGGVLPATVLLDDDALNISLEMSAPISPFGVGGVWPPEAHAAPGAGARRLPLALALAVLERTLESSDAAAVSPRWGWPRIGKFDAVQRGEAPVAELVRKSIGRLAERSGRPLALAVPNGLPLMDQSLMIGRLGRGVRLIWRCMAAGLYCSHQQAPSGRQGVGLRLGVDSDVLHVHIGLDGFEATRFSYAHHRGREGPELLVPLRSRPKRGSKVTVSWPFLGFQLCARAHWAHQPDADRLWYSLFAAGSPLEVLKAGAERVHHPEVAREDWRAGWPKIMTGVQQSRSMLEKEVEAWSGEVASLLGHRQDRRPRLILVTGDFAAIRERSDLDALVLSPARRLEELGRAAGVPIEWLEPSAIAKGAALYASRRARSWATYLDELPPVEIVVQSSAGPQWVHLLKEPHYDAGAPVEIRLDQFSLNAGERQLLLPVYVHEFGDDTPDVLATRVEFKQATHAKTLAEVVIEVEAATGLPVVRATVAGQVNETAEVDWGKDQETAKTSKTKSQYLEGLPRAFPRTEERVAGSWWQLGGQFKVVNLPAPYSGTFTGEELGALIAKPITANSPLVILVLRGFARLAAKRDRNVTLQRWVAPTDLEGRNLQSKSLEAAMAVLVGFACQPAIPSPVARIAARSLASLCCQNPGWIAYLLSQTSQVDILKENDPLISALGSCLHHEDDMGRAVHVLSRRIHGKVNLARPTTFAPVGMHSLRALGHLFSHRSDALKQVKDDVANQLAEDITLFIEMTLERGTFMQKFQAALRALVYLTRRRAYQDGFLPVGSSAFRRAVSCCAKVYIAARLSAEPLALAGDRRKRIDGYKADLKALRVAGRPQGAGAHEATCRVIDEVDMSRVRMAETQFPQNPSELLKLLVQVVEYIEGRGTGILVIDDIDEDDGE